MLYNYIEISGHVHIKCGENYTVEQNGIESVTWCGHFVSVLVVNWILHWFEFKVEFSLSLQYFVGFIKLSLEHDHTKNRHKSKPLSVSENLKKKKILSHQNCFRTSHSCEKSYWQNSWMVRYRWECVKTAENCTNSACIFNNFSKNKEKESLSCPFKGFYHLSQIFICCLFYFWLLAVLYLFFYVGRYGQKMTALAMQTWHLKRNSWQ